MFSALRSCQGYHGRTARQWARKRVVVNARTAVGVAFGGNGETHHHAQVLRIGGSRGQGIDLCLLPPCGTAESPSARWFSSSNTTRNFADNVRIRILYATTGGTAELFASQLADALEDELDITAQVESLGEYASWEELQSLQDDAKGTKLLDFFIVSTAGVGEPPLPAKAVYDDLMMTKQKKQQTPLSNDYRFAVFGLGNQTAHPNHYNVVGKTLHAALVEHGCEPALPLALGDDGDCLEDDFDQWQEQVLQHLRQQQDENQSGDAETAVATDQQGAAAVSQEETIAAPPPTQACPGARSARRIQSQKYPFLQLSFDPNRQQTKRRDLLDVVPDWYEASAQRHRVLRRTHLNPNPSANGLVELALDVSGSAAAAYQAGDHFVIYPRNADIVVDAHLNYLDVHPHAVVEKVDDNDGYRYPKGLTVYETLSHCVDLSATPSPQFVRSILQGETLNYKEQVAEPRRTALDLALESSGASSLALEDFLYNLPALQPRYYSVASSPLAKPNTLLLTYRPTRCLTSRGVLREGVCTSYLNHLQPESHSVVGALRPSPGFRLPTDPQTSLVLIAGGCGVAPIRAFLEERLLLAQQGDYSFGPAYLFLGFRDADDVAHRDVIDACLSAGVLTEAHIATNENAGTKENDAKTAWHCGNVTSAFRGQRKLLWEHFEAGGHTFICGGARGFGAAVEGKVVDIAHRHGNLSEDAASAYLRQMIAEKRFVEELA